MGERSLGMYCHWDGADVANVKVSTGTRVLRISQSSLGFLGFRLANFNPPGTNGDRRLAIAVPQSQSHIHFAPGRRYSCAFQRDEA